MPAQRAMVEMHVVEIILLPYNALIVRILNVAGLLKCWNYFIKNTGLRRGRLKRSKIFSAAV
jgi:hypothetical protein